MPSGEDDLIARYFRPLATDAGARGLVDDAAIVNAGADDLVVTTDAIVEGVHFLPDDPPDTIARKALRTNLSDLAAKGADPAGFVLTLALRQVDEGWLAPFAAALGEDAAAFGCALLGGDTVSTPGPLMISITAFGRVPKGAMVMRSGAGIDDHIMVSGSIGDAALGLRILKGEGPAALRDRAAGADGLVRRYRVPEPRIALARAVRDHASAAMDVSDGLAGDLAKLCTASGVGADVGVARVPLSDAARRWVEERATNLESLITGGDDYEILCTVPGNQLAGFEAAASEAGVPVSTIGRITASPAVPRFLNAQGRAVTLDRLSFSHF